MRPSTGPLLLLLAITACGQGGDDAPVRADAGATLDGVAEAYVKIALAFREYDGAYVDAYFGPAEWADAAASAPVPLAALRAEAARLAAAVRDLPDAAEALVNARREVLLKRLTSMSLRMDMAEGRRLPFDEESAVLFDAVAPTYGVERFRSAVGRMDDLLPGEGALHERLEVFRRAFEIPMERLEPVFDAAIDECRRRTLEHIELPAGESFTIEYVTGQPWSGYNWYKGSRYSLIEINTDLPIYVDRAVDLGCHEGYPGHHTHNVLLEDKLVDARGWIEFTLSPLYGPQSLISEGSANFGIDLAFPGDEREQFERDVLFPLAGLDPAQADRYYDVLDALEELDYALNEAARAYLNGELTREEAVEWLMRNALSTRERAEQRLRFIDTYRSYVINYNLGRDLVGAFIAREAGDDRQARWQVLERLLSQPMAPSDLL